MPRYNKPNPRRGIAPSYIVISGESITLQAAAERLNVSAETLCSRRRTETNKLKPGESLTWEKLER